VGPRRLIVVRRAAHAGPVEDSALVRRVALHVVVG
jgi:hypothetical protein